MQACCCSTYIGIHPKEADGQIKADPKYLIKHNMCYSQKGCNWCAPGCCKPVMKMEILDANNEDADALAWLYNVWPGCNAKGMTQYSALFNI